MSTKEIIFHLKNVYEGRPWYGKNILELLEQVTIEDDRIRKILLHMLAWRDFALKKVNGEDAQVEIDTTEDWPVDDAITLETIVERIRLVNTQLIAAIEKKPDAWMRQKAQSSSYNFQFLMEGIIQHDIYHTGQIVILNKTRNSSSSNDET